MATTRGSPCQPPDNGPAAQDPRGAEERRMRAPEPPPQGSAGSGKGRFRPSGPCLCTSFRHAFCTDATTSNGACTCFTTGGRHLLLSYKSALVHIPKTTTHVLPPQERYIYQETKSFDASPPGAQTPVQTSRFALVCKQRTPCDACPCQELAKFRASAQHSGANQPCRRTCE